MNARTTNSAPSEQLAATRAKLLEAAGDVFAESGYHNATVREICTRAGANVAAVNYHFGDKVALYKEVVQHAFDADDRRVIFEKIQNCTAPEEALELFIRSMFQKLQRGGKSDRYVRIMTHELAKPSPVLPHVVTQLIKPNYERLCGLIGSMIGRPPQDDLTRICVHSIIGQIIHYVHGRAVLSHLWPKLEYTPERVDQIAGCVVEFSLSGIEAFRRKVAGNTETDRL